MIELSNLSYTYEDGTKALNRINIDDRKGNIIGIIGANGSGKSTLFMNIMGILKPSEGSIRFRDKDLSYKKSQLREYRKEVNMVFQNPDHQLFYSDVYDDIAFALRNLGMEEEEVKKRVISSLESINSLDLLHKPVHFLSYGQKKRVSIAGVLAMEGKLILMDEPTSGLDPIMTDEIKNIVLEIAKTRKVFISSHDMDLIYDICDYIYVLNKGVITAEGSPEEVFLRTDILREASLKKPWLIKIHEKFNTPLFKNIDEFQDYKI